MTRLKHWRKMTVLMSGSRAIFLSVTAFAVVNVLVKSVHAPFEMIVFIRGVVCLGLSYATLRYLRLPVWGINRRWLLLRGVAGTIALSSFFYSLRALPMATAVTIQYLSPLFTIGLAGWFFGEKVRPRYWIGAALGLVGVWMIQGFDPHVRLFDVSIALLGALTSGFAYNTVRRLKTTDSEWVVMFYFPLVASVLAGPFAIRVWEWPSPGDAVLLVAIGLVTQVAQYFMTVGYQTDSASRVASVSYLGILYGLLFGTGVFGEGINLTMVAGIGLLLLGLALSQWKGRDGVR